MTIQTSKLFMLLTSLIFLQTRCLQAQEVYKSENLTITQLTESAFIHLSYLKTDDFGKVACNGLIYSSEGEAVVFDTPTTDEVSEELIQWVKDSLDSEIKAVIISHFHNDCLGGLRVFHNAGIPSYGNTRTLSLAKKNQMIPPSNAFEDKLDLEIGKTSVISQFLGEGHTADNVVVYIPDEKVLFGGCLIKEVGAGEGYTGDANLPEWSNTVTKVKETFLKAKYVVPGHGTPGGIQLLNYTIGLFDRYRND